MPRVAADVKPLADLEKAIKAHDKAVEKAVSLQEKADAAYEAQKRAERELTWYAAHPDLPEDFDLDEFRRSLEQPFDDEPEPEDDEGGVTVAEDDEDDEPFVEPNEVAVSQGDDVFPDDDGDPEPPAPRTRRGKTRPAPEPEIDDDDPFGDD